LRSPVPMRTSKRSVSGSSTTAQCRRKVTASAGGPAGKVRLGRARQGRVAGRVVLQAALPDGVAECAGQGRDKAADGGGSAACGELLVDEAGDVQVVELLEANGAERGNEILDDVVGVDGGGGRLERSGLFRQPRGEVVGDGLPVVEPDPGALAVEDAGQRGGCGLAGGVAAAAHGGASAGEAGQVDGEGPGSVSGVGCQLRTTRPELLARVAAGAASVDAAAVGVRVRHVRPPRRAHSHVWIEPRPAGDHIATTAGVLAAQRLND
jgi:hypothetical protein